MDSREFAEWIAFNGMEPFGDERADLRAALVSCTMANMWSKKKHKLKDFLFDFKPKIKQTPGDMKSLLKACCAKFKKG